ncbi:hypothetical protein BTHERMOSOX_666 [Bathymodiolus thermophilus thioautotrophic gill symbiont]|uniref:Uncharacterized protein n=1 Tax=Bathymodiolus thermophilus thioautotrophic gill symbiont TaxID=2360 RepID=A0A8H9CIJ6_9GAMM|nr:hypothetical protein THERMOS_2159 [Bathymodiolus thermophilus thioautotrophic gill symbiont]SGZ74342.1 hypothetical protein BTHERMOSOX_666 [Bathymodiolus thermophilus thioautotrophic gill symbiont]
MVPILRMRMGARLFGLFLKMVLVWIGKFMISYILKIETFA